MRVRSSSARMGLLAMRRFGSMGNSLIAEEVSPVMSTAPRVDDHRVRRGIQRTTRPACGCAMVGGVPTFGLALPRSPEKCNATKCLNCSTNANITRYFCVLTSRVLDPKI
jgi:hypothetical protein